MGLDSLTFPSDEKSGKWRDVALIVLIVVLMVVIILTQTFSLSEVSGTSMMGTVHDGDFIVSYRVWNTLSHGDIVTAPVTKNTANGKTRIVLIKRIVACPGDRLVFQCDEYGIVSFYLDRGDGFKLLDEPYIFEKTMRRSIFEAEEMFSNGKFKLYSGDMSEISEHEECIISLGDDEYFLLGDNRNNSKDSREYGVFHRKNILGKVSGIYSEGSPGYGFYKFIYSLFPSENTDDQATIQKGDLYRW